MLLNKILEFSCAFSPDLDKLTSSLCCRILACTFSTISGVVFVVLSTTISTIPLTSTIVVVIITPFISLPLRVFAYINCCKKITSSLTLEIFLKNSCSRQILEKNSLIRIVSYRIQRMVVGLELEKQLP